MRRFLGDEEAMTLKLVVENVFHKRKKEAKHDHSPKTGVIDLPEPLRIADIVIPPGAEVFFPPQRSRSYGDGIAASRSASHAIIFIDPGRGTTMRIEGTFTSVVIRNP